MNSLLFPWEEEKLPPPSSLVVTFFIWLGVGFLLDYCISKIKKLHRESKTNIRAVEKILSYRFKNKTLLQDALTHSAYTNHNNGKSFRPYKLRLEFLGDAVLRFALGEHLYSTYPGFNTGELSSLRDANVSNEKLAHVAVHHGLHHHIRHNAATSLVDEIQEFADAVSRGDGKVLYGSTKVPKILADIVESLAAAIYVDLKFDLHKLWAIFENLLEPIVTLEDLQQQPKPVKTFFEQCQKQGRKPEIKNLSSGENNIARAYVDGVLVALGSSDQMVIARRNAAKLALLELPNFMPTNIT